MKHGLNFDETDSNYMLLNEIFKIIGSRESIVNCIFNLIYLNIIYSSFN